MVYYTVMEAFTCFFEFTTHGTTAKLINTVQITPFITSMFSITLALNIIATCMSPHFLLAQNTANLRPPPPSIDCVQDMVY